MVPTEQLQIETRYWVRVWIVAKALLTGYRQMPARTRAFCASLRDFSEDAIWFFWFLVLPLLFWLAPLWLWLLELDTIKQRKAREEARRKFFASREKLKGGANHG